MKRILRLTEFWNWLPVFRVVAETEHLPTAAAKLHVSPSALSRTIGLLEKSIGKPLFNREGRHLRLNSTGERFLDAVRDSMRRMDDGLRSVTGNELSGPIHMAVVGPFNATIGPVLSLIEKAHPGLVPYLHLPVPGKSLEMLLRGELDLSIVVDPAPHPELDIERIAEMSGGIYCGKGHPLFRARKLTLERILEYPFTAGVPGEGTAGSTGWPAELPRKITLYVQLLVVALDVCARGQALAAFPDEVVRTCTQRHSLRRLPVEVIPPVPLYVMRRKRLIDHDRTDAVIDVMRKHWA